MNFSSPAFLLVFLPLLVAAIAAARWLGGVDRSASAQNGVLLVFSLVFYTYGSGVLVGLLFAVAALAHGAGRAVAAGAGRRSDLAAGSAIAVIVALLLFFKYTGFLVADVGFGEWLSADANRFAREIALPIGISFYVFQAISYVADVWAGRIQAERHFSRLLLYLAMLPQLVAGPIVRYASVAQALDERGQTLEDAVAGTLRFCHGLFKKVVVADTLAVVAGAGFDDPQSLSTSGAWLVTLCFTLQIYFDFSGYSDMAIGLGRLLGFRFPENFRRPYSAATVTEFWRRWHITLSNFFRDYVYIPLGGNRRGSRRTGTHLLLVFVLTGLWHGAAWTFLVWGLLHGALLVLERVLGLRHEPEGWLTLPRRLVTQWLVALAWVVFAATDFATAEQVFVALFACGPEVGAADAAAFEDLLTREFWIVLVAASLVYCVPRERVLGVVLEATAARGGLPFAAAAAWALAALATSLIYVAAHEFSPFLYFQF